MDYKTIYDLLDNCYKCCDDLKDLCNTYKLSQYEVIHNLSTVKDPYQQVLIRDIIKKILKQVFIGKNNCYFDLQYTNPHKDWYKPGPPKLVLSEEGHQWFRQLGFKTKNINKCFNVSTSCEFYCSGDGIGKVLIEWDTKLVVMKNNKKRKLNQDNEFNAAYCTKMSKLFKKQQDIKDLCNTFTTVDYELTQQD